MVSVRRHVLQNCDTCLSIYGVKKTFMLEKSLRKHGIVHVENILTGNYSRIVGL